METALVLSWSQIVDGAATCSYCEAPATVTLSTGADPEPDSLCWEHAAEMINWSLSIGWRLFGVAA